MHADDMQKIFNDIMSHFQVQDADDPSTDMSSCCYMMPIREAALQLADVHGILSLKIKAFPA